MRESSGEAWQRLGDQSVWKAVGACKVKADAETIQAYLQALANADFGFAFRRGEGGVEMKTVTFPGSPGLGLPVFTDEESWAAFAPVLQGFPEVRTLRGAELCKLVIEDMPQIATLMVDPARVDFLKMPRTLMESVAKAQRPSTARR